MEYIFTNPLYCFLIFVVVSFLVGMCIVVLSDYIAKRHHTKNDMELIKEIIDVAKCLQTQDQWDTAMRNLLIAYDVAHTLPYLRGQRKALKSLDAMWDQMMGMSVKNGSGVLIADPLLWFMLKSTLHNPVKGLSRHCLGKTRLAAHAYMWGELQIALEREQAV